MVSNVKLHQLAVKAAKEKFDETNIFIFEKMNPKKLTQGDQTLLAFYIQD